MLWVVAARADLEDISEAVLIVQRELLLQNSKGCICLPCVLLACSLWVIAAPVALVAQGALLGSLATP